MGTRDGSLRIVPITSHCCPPLSSGGTRPENLGGGNEGQPKMMGGATKMLWDQKFNTNIGDRVYLERFFNESSDLDLI